MADLINKIREGQTVKVFQSVNEGKRDRTVAFIGKVMKVRGKDENKTITVAQTLEGIGVERIFPLASPKIAKIEVVEEKPKTVKRAKKVKKRTKK